MSDLDKKLERVLRPYFAAGGLHHSSALQKCVDEVKRAFIDAGYIPSDLKKKANQLIQDMTDIHANMKHDLVRLSLNTTPTKHVADFSDGQLSKLMTGQEWYDRYQQSLAGKVYAFDENGATGKIVDAVNACDLAAKKAAGIEQ